MTDPRQVVTQFSIAGSTFIPGASARIERLPQLQSLTLKREPTNKYDKNAVLVMWGAGPLGYVPRGLAAKIAPLMDAGVSVIARRARSPLYGVSEVAYIPPET